VRLFVAIEIPEDIRRTLAALLHEFRSISPRLKWVRPENMHLTLAFLGETEPAKFSEVQTALSTIRSPQPVSLEFRGLGFFPNAKRPRVFWVGIEASSNLAPIAREIDRSLHELGFLLNDRPFAPHLTLARLNQPYLPADLQTIVTESTSRSFGSFSAQQFHLIESKLKLIGPEYTTLQSFSFMPEA
jgi:2'-5' RNA ligase